MNILAQIIGLFAISCFIVSVQFKNKKFILLFLILGNGLFVANFLLLNAYSGAMTCLIATIETILSYYYENKKVRFPVKIAIFFIIFGVILTFLSYQQIFDIIPFFCLVSYTLLIMQKKERNIRKISVLNALLWVTYDIIVGAYSAALSDVFVLISSFIAIFRYDFKG